MGKKRNEPKPKGFEKVLATLPEYEGFRAQKDYDWLRCQEDKLQGFLELLFSLLKRYSTVDPNQQMFWTLLSPALKANGNDYDMFYRNMIDEELPNKVDSWYLVSYVCAVYRELVASKYGTPTQQMAIKLRYDLLANNLFPQNRKFGEEILISSLKASKITKDTVGNFHEDATPSEIFDHLTFALRNEMSHVAHEIIGGLRYIKKDFPQGDPEFWYALVNLKDNSAETLRRAISYMDQIPKTFRHYHQVYNMKAEAHARLGDYDYFEQMAMGQDSPITELSMRGYLQMLIKNLDMEEIEADRLDALFLRYYQAYDTGPELGSRKTVPEQNSLPLLICKENVLSAVKEVYGFYTQVMSVSQIWKDGEDIPKSVSRALLLLRLSANDVLEDLRELIRDNTGDKRFAFIHRWFMVTANKDNQVFARPLNLALEAGRTISGDEEFVDAFEADLDIITKTEGIDLGYWAAELYMAAVACNHPKQDLICRVLEKLNPNSEKTFQQQGVYQKVRRYLRGHEQLLYAAADSAYQKAKQDSQDYGWKDCGMVSLNYFRILEVELRDHIFVKAFRSQENQAVIEAFCNKLKPYVLSIELKSQTGEDVSEERKTIRAKCGSKNKFDFPRTIEALRKPQNMELGPMWYALRFLEDKCRVETQWQPYQQALRQMVYDVLSEDGIEAIQDGTIEKAISEKLREEYRNPPAHARYLPFSKACECRDHVNETLLQLHGQWLKKA